MGTQCKILYLMEIEMAQQQVKIVDINLIGADHFRASVHVHCMLAPLYEP